MSKKVNEEVKIIADAMLEKKAKDVISLDLRKIGTAVADYFVICNADSSTQVQAIADAVEEAIDAAGHRVVRQQ